MRIRGAESREVLERPLAEMTWWCARRVELDVIESFSGPAGKRFVLYSGLGGDDCGVEFTPGQILPPGRYHMQVSLPGWQLLNTSSGDEEVELSPRGCAEMPINLEPGPKSKN